MKIDADQQAWVDLAEFRVPTRIMGKQCELADAVLPTISYC